MLSNKDNENVSAETISDDAKVQETENASPVLDKTTEDPMTTPTEVQTDTEVTEHAGVASTEESPEVKAATSTFIEHTNSPTDVEMTVTAEISSGTKSPLKAETVNLPEKPTEVTAPPVNEPKSAPSTPIAVEISDATTEKDESMSCEVPPNEENINASATVVTNPEGKTDQQIVGNQSHSKENYRTIEVSSDSESEDSDSSSSSSDSSEPINDGGINGDSDADCDDSMLPAPNKKNGPYPVIKVKGELQIEDLPPLDELHISVPSSLCAEVGVVTSIVNTLVVVQAHKGIPVLDLESVLFLDTGSRALGLVFDVIGPVNEPLYCVRFNSTEHIEEFQVKPGDKVYYAPTTEHSKYVFLQQLLKMRGSDASWRNDVEPTVQIDFSDDEEERRIRKGTSSTVNNEDDQQKRKREQTEESDSKKKLGTKTSYDQRYQRGGMTRTGNYMPRPSYQRQQSNYSHQGPIRSSSFTVPDLSTPPPPAQRSSVPPPQSPTMSERGNSCYSYPPPISQQLPPYNSQPYQNPVQPTSSFGQLPYGPAQPQIDPRIIQFGTQFAHMMCAFQAATSPAVNLPPQPPPSFNMPCNQSHYSGNQNMPNSFASPGHQTQQSYSLAPFNTPPPMAPTGPPNLPPNLPPTNVPPPTRAPQTPPAPHNFWPGQNSSYGQHYSSPHSSNHQGRR